jgi:hypothetical protein
MKLPFTPEQFMEVFKNYNESVFPFQIVLNVLGLIALYLAIRNNRYSAGIISIILTFFWLWMGVTYHLIFFSTINKAAYLFGLLFALQGLIFFYQGALKNKFYYELKFNIYSIVGIGFIVYAMIIYPVIGYLYGHRYPFSPTFGLPCPTTIFTFGILLLNTKKISFKIIAILLLWSIIGFSAAVNLGMIEDTGLIAAAVISVLLLYFRYKPSKFYSTTH